MELKKHQKVLLYLVSFVGFLVLYLSCSLIIEVIYITIFTKENIDYSQALNLKHALIFSLCFTLVRTKSEKYRYIQRRLYKANDIDEINGILDYLFKKKKWKLQKNATVQKLYLPKYRLFCLFGRIEVIEEQDYIELYGPEIYVDKFVDEYFERYKK